MARIASYLTGGPFLRTAFRTHEERGANLVEYALLMALVAVVCATALSQFGGATASAFGSAATAL